MLNIEVKNYVSYFTEVCNRIRIYIYIEYVKLWTYFQ